MSSVGGCGGPGRTVVALVSFGAMLASGRSEAMQPHASFAHLCHDADLIVVGTVGRTATRLAGTARVVVTDVVFDDLRVVHQASFADAVPIGASITLSHAGGEFGALGVSVSDQPQFVVGERYLLFALFDGRSYLHPLIGGNQGLFRLRRDDGTGIEYPLTGEGRGIRRIDGAELSVTPRVDEIRDGFAISRPVAIDIDVGPRAAPGSADAARSRAIETGPAPILNLEQFLDAIDAELAALPPRTSLRLDRARDPSAAPAPPAKTALLDAVPLVESAGESADAQHHQLAPDGGGAAALCWCGSWGLNLVMEMFSAQGGHWSWQENSDGMWQWNQFMDVFRFVADDGSFGNNNQNEFVGWPSDATVTSVYGSGWGTSLAVTWTFWPSGCPCCRLTQADVMFNPANTWTTDFDASFDLVPVLYRPVLVHELGHAFGMQRGSCTEDYSYNALSAMHAYYSNIVEDGWGIHQWDAVAIRDIYDDQVGIIARHDVGVESYYATGNITNATTDRSTYTVGDPIEVQNITAENLSSFDTAGVRLRLYLSPDRSISSGDTQIGSHWHWDVLSTWWSGNLSSAVPSVPPGEYWVGVIITTGGDAFAFDDLNFNNTTWLRDRVTIRWPSPSNDNCSSAFEVGPGTFSGATFGANGDGGTGCPAGAAPSVWYALTAACDGEMTVDTCGSAYDTVVSIHDGCFGSEVACNDDCTSAALCTGLSSCVTASVRFGQRYFVRVSGFNGAAGTYALRIAFTCPPPANDDCSRAIDIVPGSYEGTTLGATPDLATVCPAAGSPSVWYAVTPACDTTLSIDTCGSQYDTLVSLHGSCAGDELACNDDCADASVCGGLDSCLGASVVRGRRYLIRVSGFNGRAGAFRLRVATGCADSGPRFVRGDCNGAGSVDISDAVRGLETLFLGRTVPCRDACDANDSGAFDISDMVLVLNALFTGGRDPSPPFPGCGTDPTADALDCDQPPPSCN